MGRIISVVDDDDEMRNLLSLVLGKAGYKANTYPTAGKFFDGILRHKPALCVIDVQLPGMDGREIVRVMRANPETKMIPVIMVSAFATSSADMTRGVESGADEYFQKPLDVDLLLVRIANLLIRSGQNKSQTLPSSPSVQWEDIEVFPDEHRVIMRDNEIALTNLEFKLLLSFLRQPNRVLPRSWLLQTVWNSSSAVTTRTVDKHVENLRRKLPPLASKLETVVGVGYLFRP